MKKVMLIFGTRPEAIKMAPLVKAYQAHPDKFETIVCVTAQHREMLDQVLTVFDIHPDYDLNIMKAGQDLYDITSRVLLGLRDVLTECQPDLVLVHGDTTTSTAAALAAFYQQIPVAHVEAGLRTHNLYSPWPEEANRQLTSRLAKYHFAPTELSKQNLLREGINEADIYVVGNTVIDALHLALNKIESAPELRKSLDNTLKTKGYNLCSSVSSVDRKIILVTGHRRENHGQGIINICNALKQIAEKYPEVDIVYPVHLSPNVQKPVYEILGKKTSASADNNLCQSEQSVDNIFLIEPLEYLPFLHLMSQSTIVLTDSGGIQEEAPGLGKPVIVMRDTTERPEAVEAGTVKLVGTNTNLIVSEISRLLDDKAYYESMSHANNPYGDGQACERIIEVN
jgi:UDP-N-acetylglucosamine 2-epimerase (non-hydrolysing)